MEPIPTHPPTTGPTAAGPTREDAVVWVDGLSKRFGPTLALEDVTLALARGTITGLVGPNGAGKTTLLRVLLGFAGASAGEALIFGARYRDLPEPARRVGALLDAGDVHPGRTGRDHLRVLAMAAGIPVARVDTVLALVELEWAARRRTGTYSLGMRQRLGLAGALLGEPELLVLDEPGNGLDPSGLHWLRGFLRAFAGGGGTVLISSHGLAELEQTIDEVAVIDRGRLLRMAPIRDLVAGGRRLEDAYLEISGGTR